MTAPHSDGTPANWVRDMPEGWTPEQVAREAALNRSSTLRNYAFIGQHWHDLHTPQSAREAEDEYDAHRYACDAFDPVRRTCTAHSSRPPVCSGYPFYGKPPEPADADALWHSCAYQHDIPREPGPVSLGMPTLRP